MQSEPNNPLKEFSLQFFKSLGCKIEEEEKCLKILGAPSSFEKMLGKPAPYTLVFSQTDVNDGNELIVKGSYFLKTMLSYADSKGQTALVKLDIPFDGTKTVLDNLKFYNAELIKTAHKARYESVVRFSFTTTFQYLNEKEQLKNDVDIFNGEIVEFDTKGYEIKDGRKEEVTLPNVQEGYKKAKAKVKEEISKKTEELSELLNTRLEKEQERVITHFSKQLKEIDESVERSQRIISEAEKQMLKANESEKEALSMKIARAKEQIAKINPAEVKQKVEQEKEFFLADETNKHGLSIDSKLSNTTIIYYPIFVVYAVVRQTNEAKRTREFSFEFNPLTKVIQGIKCDSCSEEVRHFALCAGGHLSCQMCADQCLDCGQVACKICLKKECYLCDKKSCERCIVKCPGCWKHVCKSHSVVDSLNGRELCQNCVKNCEHCRKATDKKNFVACPICKKDFCERCIRREFISGRVRTGCLSCLKKESLNIER